MQETENFNKFFSVGNSYKLVHGVVEDMWNLICIPWLQCLNHSYVISVFRRTAYNMNKLVKLFYPSIQYQDQYYASNLCVK